MINHIKNARVFFLSFFFPPEEVQILIYKLMSYGFHLSFHPRDWLGCAVCRLGVLLCWHGCVVISETLKKQIPSCDVTQSIKLLRSDLGNCLILLTALKKPQQYIYSSSYSFQCQCTSLLQSSHFITSWEMPHRESTGITRLSFAILCKGWARTEPLMQWWCKMKWQVNVN